MTLPKPGPRSNLKRAQPSRRPPFLEALLSAVQAKREERQRVPEAAESAPIQVEEPLVREGPVLSTAPGQCDWA